MVSLPEGSLGIFGPKEEMGWKKCGLYALLCGFRYVDSLQSGYHHSFVTPNSHIVVESGILSGKPRNFIKESLSAIPRSMA